MLSIVLVLGIHITVRIRNCWTRYSTNIQNDNEYALCKTRCIRKDYGAYGFGHLKRGGTGRILSRCSRCTGGLVMFCCINSLHWIQTVRVQWGTCANLLRLGALGILPSISLQIKLSTDGICWTSRRWMFPASMHSSLD